MKKIDKILENYSFPGKLINTEENTQGLINSTYIVEYEYLGVIYRYVLQKINTTVFKEPYVVMNNIEYVTSHIQKKIALNNDKNHKTLNVVYTKDGSSTATIINEDGEREYYRIYDFIDNCKSYNSVHEHEDPEFIAYNAGRGLGYFHNMLDDFSPLKINETIPDFHNTPKRFNTLLEAIQNNVTKRAFNFPSEILYIITRFKECSVIYDNLGGSIPLRVTHNDTKINNFLMDKTTSEATAVIDLDTVMPGSALYDVGDGIRSTCATAKEDEKDLSKVSLDMNLTKAYLSGYLDEMGDKLTSTEIHYLASSIKILTYELAMRFLTDYINGDTYFKIKYPEHNKDRFNNQFKLFLDAEKKCDEIELFINDYLNKQKGQTLVRKK